MSTALIVIILLITFFYRKVLRRSAKTVEKALDQFSDVTNMATKNWAETTANEILAESEERKAQGGLSLEECKRKMGIMD